MSIRSSSYTKHFLIKKKLEMHNNLCDLFWLEIEVIIQTVCDKPSNFFYCTVGRKIIRAVEISRVKKLMLNEV